MPSVGPTERAGGWSRRTRHTLGVSPGDALCGTACRDRGARQPPGGRRAACLLGAAVERSPTRDLPVGAAGTAHSGVPPKGRGRALPRVERPRRGARRERRASEARAPAAERGHRHRAGEAERRAPPPSPSARRGAAHLDPGARDTPHSAVALQTSRQSCPSAGASCVRSRGPRRAHTGHLAPRQPGATARAGDG